MVHKTKRIKGMIDVFQDVEAGGKLFTVPEIRVWVHPKRGSDYYYKFESLKRANKWSRLVNKALLKGDPRAIRRWTFAEKPLVAFMGYEMTPKDFKQQFPSTKLP